jgi:exosome complex component RRP46
MAYSTEPVAELAPLPKADGPATFSYGGYTVTAAVNGPIEAQRRDENAFEALVDVNIRPAAGVGGTAERQLEAILQSALRQLIPVRDYPRCMIQITLQLVETPENAYVNAKVVQAQLNLLSIPALMHAAVLGLLTAAVPLKYIATATVLAIPASADQGGKAAAILVDPSPADADKAKSVHALGFTSDDELLLMESEGEFTVEEMKVVLATAEKVCGQGAKDAEQQDTAMVDSAVAVSGGIKAFIRSVMETKTAADLRWK